MKSATRDASACSPTAAALTEELAPCLAEPAHARGFLAEPLPGLDDEEGARIPDGLPPLIDAHVHLFPDRLFQAVWRWFDRWGWPVRYRISAREVVHHLLTRGIGQLVALHYAHKPGIADGLNRFMAEVCRSEPRVLGVATVFPGEPDARGVLERGFALGLRGVKLHCHVQCIAPDDPALHEIYALCAERDLPLVMHAGREPSSPGYACDPHALCSADRVERVLRDHPRLRLCVPHLGADEFDAYARLIERYDTLWLDTTMAIADYFPCPSPNWLLTVRPERIMYGTDFPNIPYAWDRELVRLARSGLPEPALAQVLGETAREFFRIRFTAAK